MQCIVSVHSTAGSMGEALDSERQTTVADEQAAEALAADLRAAIARDKYNRHYALVQVTTVSPPVALPAGLAGDDLWAWVKKQTCCLDGSDDD
jgi:hypothetical protein